MEGQNESRTDAKPDDAETFGAAALGLSKDEYYKALCEMADEIG